MLPDPCARWRSPLDFAAHCTYRAHVTAESHCLSMRTLLCDGQVVVLQLAQLSPHMPAVWAANTSAM